MRRVVKVGGSLLSRPNLPSDLDRWLVQQTSAETAVIVGGGARVDAVRRSDQLAPGNQIDIHWKCVDLLEQTRNHMATLIDWDTVSTSEELDRCIDVGFPSDRPTLVSVCSFYDRRTRVDVPLDWRTTSDTIAAILAIRAKADELVLLKSCEVDPCADIQSLADRGIVDEALPQVGQDIALIRVERLDAV